MVLTIIENQLGILLAAILSGSIATFLLLLRAGSRRTWRIVDLFWILVGGLGASVAFVVSIYLSSVEDTQRSLNLLKSRISNLHEEAAGTRARYCSSDSTRRIENYYSAPFDLICDAVSAIVGQTLNDSEAFKLVGLMEENGPENSETETSLDTMKDFESIFSELKNGEFHDQLSGDWKESYFFGFDPKNPKYEKAELELIQSGVYTQLAIEYRILKGQFEELTVEFDGLSDTWAEIVRRGSVLNSV
jgi:hypothetical protein